ncbi:hypothetical protein KY345_05235 [Candidatus Woesearchaeota archaeon]|nr:hypothetical protein [Candidatus Woesearchaeota archaeon]
MNHITKLNPWKTALFISIFEFFALLILPYPKFNNIINGLIVGFAGALLAIITFNLTSDYLKLNLMLDKKQVILKKLGYFIPSLACSIFLGVLFLTQEYMEFSFRSQLLNDALLGFFATLVAMIICIFIYNIINKFTKFRLAGITSDGKFRIKKIDISRTSFFVALVELFILPVMGFFFILLQNLPLYIRFPLVGLFGGFTGTLIASFFYNLLARYFKGIGFELE